MNASGPQIEVRRCLSRIFPLLAESVVMLIRLLRFLIRLALPTPQPPRETPSSLAGRDLSGQPGSATRAVPSAGNTKVGSGSPAAQKGKSLSGLNTDKFAPMSVADALSATSAADWRSANFDSRSVIPPADLPRIQVIDRTMVGMGLISEQELAEIHDIGREMTQFQSDAAFIHQAGERAVAISREERQRLKEQKKAEAEQRRVLRRQQVAHRRATDIVFLGRGVSQGLADRRSNIEKLQAGGLPLLSSPAELANAMGLTISKLRWLAFHSDAPTRVHYVSFNIPKKSGGTRRLSAPHQQLAAAQHWILTNILNLIPVHQNAHGFVAQHSVVTNAAPHVGSSVVINADLKDFFPSITLARVDGLFRRIGYSPAIATILALLCTECPRDTVTFCGTTYHAAIGPRALPQGACTSPAISNLVAHKLDRRMSAMADKLGWRYTRYADDLTWSIEAEPSPSVGYVLARIRHIVDDEGFSVNHEKTRVQRRSQQQSVTGVVVNDRLSVSRDTIREIRAILHNAKSTGLAAQNRNEHPHFESWLAGMIGWIEMVNPQQGGKLRTQWVELQRK